MNDPLNREPAVNPNEVRSGACALLGFVGTIAIIVIIGLVWFLYFNPSAKPMGNSSATETEPTPGPTQTLVAAGNPIPSGPLEFGVFILNVTAPCNGQASATLNKGGQPLAPQAPVEFNVWVNGNSTAFNRMISAGQHQLDFNAAPTCASGGTIRFRAKIGNDEIARAFYNSGLPTKDAGKSGMGSMQVDAEQYPDLVTYFGLTGSDGSATRLSGATQTQVMQDGSQVSNFTMSFIDPNADPVTVALLLDVSGSMSGEPLTHARQAALDFINALGPKDSACIYSFSTAVKQNQRCTTDRKAATAAVNTLAAAGNTALYDALVAVAADHAGRPGRQAIIVLSDGADTASKANMNDALGKIKQTNVPLFTVGLKNKDLNSTILRQLASANGGTYLEAPTSADLKGLYSKLQTQLKNQYRVDFKSLYPDRKSGTISVRLTMSDQTLESSRTFFAK